MNKSTGNLWDSAGEGAYARMSQAWQWLCEQRDNAPEGADVWDVRWQALSTGPEWLTDLTHQVLRGEYRLAPLQLQGKNENRKAVWLAQDALVLKWTALSLQHLLPLHPACEHVKGHGGGRQSIMKLHGLLTQDACDPGGEKKTAATAASIDDAMPQVNTGLNDDAVQAVVNSRQYKWVCRTDIRGYYRNIDKQTLLSQVRQHVLSPVLRDLVDQYIHYTVEDGGTFHTPEKGISRGCPLSPLMGALHLYDMDEHFAKQANIHYARYMDDVIILAKSRWQLRKHTKRLMQWFKGYGFEAHPDKTYIGRTEKGFDWMGAWLTHEGVRDIAPRAKANHREKVRRLYERLARVPLWRRKRARQEVHAKVSTYRKRWKRWAGALVAPAAFVWCTLATAHAALGDQVGSGNLRSYTSTWGVNKYGGTTEWSLKRDPGGAQGGIGADPYHACPANTVAWTDGQSMSAVSGRPNYVACLPRFTAHANLWGGCNLPPASLNFNDTSWVQACSNGDMEAATGLEQPFLPGVASAGTGAMLSLQLKNNNSQSNASANIDNISATYTIHQAVDTRDITAVEPTHAWFNICHRIDTWSVCGAGGGGGTNPPPIPIPKPPLVCLMGPAPSTTLTTFNVDTSKYVDTSQPHVLLDAQKHVQLTVSCTAQPSAAGYIDMRFTQGAGGGYWSGSPYGGYQLLPTNRDTYLMGYTAAGKGCSLDASSIYFDGAVNHDIPVLHNTEGNTPNTNYTVDTWWSLCNHVGTKKLGTVSMPVVAEVHLR